MAGPPARADTAAMDPAAMLACLTCDAEARALMVGHRFALLAATILPSLLVGGFAVAAAARAWGRRRGGDDAGTFAAAAVLLGLGLGGFVDGIVLHQLLQVHAMISNSLPPDTLAAKSVNMVWDGVFHVGTWILTLAGVLALWRVARRRPAALPGALLAGGLLAGWGAFNALDTLLNHLVFRYHDVVEASARPWAWNAAFAALALVQLAAGALLIRRGFGVGAAR